MGDFIASLKSYKTIRITFCWQNNFSQGRQGTLLVLKFPSCLCSVFCHTCTCNTAQLIVLQSSHVGRIQVQQVSVYFKCSPEKLCPCSTLLLVFIQHFSLSLHLSPPCPQNPGQQSNLWANGHPSVLKSGGSKKKKMLHANYSLLQNPVSVQNGIT